MGRACVDRCAPQKEEYAVLERLVSGREGGDPQGSVFGEPVGDKAYTGKARDAAGRHIYNRNDGRCL